MRHQTNAVSRLVVFTISLLMLLPGVVQAQGWTTGPGGSDPCIAITSGRRCWYDFSDTTDSSILQIGGCSGVFIDYNSDLGGTNTDATINVRSCADGVTASAANCNAVTTAVLDGSAGNDGASARAQWLYIDVVANGSSRDARVSAQCTKGDGTIDVPSAITFACNASEVLEDLDGSANWACQPAGVDVTDDISIADCVASDTVCFDGIEWECCPRVPDTPTDWSQDADEVAFWSFDNSGDFLQNDANPGTHDLTQEGACDLVTTSAASPINNMLPTANTYTVHSSEGTNGCSRLSAPDAAALDPAGAAGAGFSFGCWIRLREELAQTHQYYGKLNASGTQSWGLRASATEIIYMKMGTDIVQKAGVLADFDWHHTVGTYAGDDAGTPANAIFKLYVDGCLEDSDFVASGVLPPSTVVVSLSSGSNPLDGTEDNCFLIDQELNAAEVLGITNFGWRGDAVVSRGYTCP